MIICCVRHNNVIDISQPLYSNNIWYDLSRKIVKTYEASQKEDYQSFLSYFGKFEVAKVENKSIAESEAIEQVLNKMTVLESQIKNLSLFNHELPINTITSTDNLIIDYTLQYIGTLPVIISYIK